MTEVQLLAEIEMLAVRGETQLICRVNLRSMTQDHQEDIRHYSARVKGQAALCNYVIKCTGCEAAVSYADDEIRDQICTGLADPDIQRDVLALRKQHPTTEALISFIEDREAGKRSQTALATPSNTIGKISEYKRNKVQSNASTQKAVQMNPNDVCNFCGSTGHGKRAPFFIRKTQCPAFSKSCETCGLTGHIRKMCRHNISNKSVSGVSYEKADFLGSIQIHAIKDKSRIRISHREYSQIDGWITNNPR